MSVLDIEKVRENLVSDEILEILKRGRIKAHNGLGSPLSSQASCLNFWYPYTKPENKKGLLKILHNIGIDAEDIITTLFFVTNFLSFCNCIKKPLSSY